MRIISENRFIDVPYDLSVIRVVDERIVADICDLRYELAHPDTYKQAKSALSAIQDAYLSGAKVVYMDFIMEETRDT